MRTTLIHQCATFVLATCLFGTSVMQPAAAAIISTETAIEIEQRQVQVDRISAVLAQENVQTMLIEMGVDPVAAGERVAAMTNDELRLLNEQLDEMPAGATGVVEVVGIVAIVLIVLELLNVTNFFTEF